MNGLTMLLPHGYEGQGSEHSSGRMERFLQLCAENNMQICNCTTPANFFHLLRRQIITDYRKPLVVFTPKKLLRYPKAVSSLKELAGGYFQPVINDSGLDANSVDTLVLCTGKIYYELLEEREKLQVDNIAFIRLEQLYPLPIKQLEKVLASYSKKVKLLWVQEEPENMGAWNYMLRALRSWNLEVISTPASASPAAGSPKVHEKRMKEMMSKVFAHAQVSASK